MTLLFVALLFSADQDPDWLVATAALAATTAFDNRADATRQLASAKKGRINARAFGVNKKGETIYRDKEDKLRAIKRAQDEINECNSILAGTGSPKLPPRALREGDFGTLFGFVRVQQVVSPNAAIVDVITEYAGVPKVSAWLDTDTSGWQDDKSYRLSDPIRVVGTKQYPTAIGGTRTVLHIATMTDQELKRIGELVKETAKLLQESDTQTPTSKATSR